ncbi:unnamed protein product [Lathyrus sativus]|nr:unnamed protein product [Lathyrus sativus]
MEEFLDFIEKLDLEELLVIGSKFTWRKSDGSVCSRLDRILISSGLVNSWNIIGVEIGHRDISDHCLVWLKCDFIDWGPKPFRFIPGWFEHKEFKSFIEK